jgi:hypothetical protein
MDTTSYIVVGVLAYMAVLAIVYKIKKVVRKRKKLQEDEYIIDLTGIKKRS